MKIVKPNFCPILAYCKFVNEYFRTYKKSVAKEMCKLFCYYTRQFVWCAQNHTYSLPEDIGITRERGYLEGLSPPPKCILAFLYEF